MGSPLLARAAAMAGAWSSVPSAQVLLQHPPLHPCQGRQHATWQRGLAPWWTGLHGWTKHSLRAACMWPACSGGFLTNRHGVPGTAPTAVHSGSCHCLSTHSPVNCSGDLAEPRGPH